MPSKLSYVQSGVSIDRADQAKADMAKSLTPIDSRILNRHGAFASLFEAKFPGIENPVLVLKAEEPGSKQLLAFQHECEASVMIWSTTLSTTSWSWGQNRRQFWM